MGTTTTLAAAVAAYRAAVDAARAAGTDDWDRDAVMTAVQAHADATGTTYSVALRAVRVAGGYAR